MHSTPPATRYDFEDSYAVDPAAMVADPTKDYDKGEVSLAVDGQVQRGLNLFLPLKNPGQQGMFGLLAAIDAQAANTQKALRDLHYVHFARFVPTPDFSTLIVVTEYDGDLRSYVMDFVAVLGDVFTLILENVADAPPLPVQKYPEEFWQYVKSHNLDVPVWSAYPHMSVIDILRARRPR